MGGLFRINAGVVNFPKLFILLLVFGIAVTGWYAYNSKIFPIKLINPFDYVEMQQIKYTHLLKKRNETDISYTADSLPRWDYTTLINFTGFSFLLENSVCIENEPLTVLIALHTAPKNIERRNSIRETWGQPRKGMKLLFFVGAVQNQTIQDDLDSEDREHHDIIQGNFVDAYKNLTYKHTMIFKYAVYYCPTVKYILKGDDDLYVNIEHVLHYLENNMTEKNGDYQKNLILGHLMDGSPTIRIESKWFVSFDEFPHSAYPVYVSGFAVIYSYDVAFRLYREAQRGEYFWVDDAFVSGTLAKRINVKHVELPNNVFMTYELMYNLFNGNYTGYNKDFWYGPTNIGYELVRKLWNVLHDDKYIEERSIN